MNTTLKKILINPYTISIVAMIVIIIALFVGTFSWLDSYTNHNIVITVPDLTDLTPAEAEEVLKEKNLRCQVIDSVFMKGKKLGVIVEQTPAANSSVKEGRAIYLITNSNSIRKVALPDVRETSLRQAEAIINSVGLKVDSIQYVPSEYKDLVRDVRSGNKTLAPGTRIPEGSAIVLLVGKGDNQERVVVPSLRSLNADQAIGKLHAAYLNIGELYYDVPPKDDKDKDNYFIYKQKPVTGTPANLGDIVNIYLSKDPTLLEGPEDAFSAAPQENSTIEEKDEIFQ